MTGNFDKPLLDRVLLLNKIAHVLVRGPSFPHRPPCRLSELPRPSPPLLSLFAAAHHCLRRIPYRRGIHHSPLFRLHSVLLHPDRHSDPQHVDYQPLVEELLRKQGPRHQREARAHPLEARVPPAVRHEPSDRGMVEYQYLRSPPSYDQASSSDPLFEPFGDPLVAVAPHGPDERVAAGLEAQRHLAELGRSEVAHAPETDVQDRTGALAVEPPQAVVAADGGLVSPRGLIGVVVPVAQSDGAYMPGPPPDHLPVVPRVVRLQLVEAVHHHSVALRLRLSDLIEELPRLFGGIGDLRPEHLDTVGEAGDDEGLGLRGEGLERPVPVQALGDAEREEAGAVEDEPGDPETRRDVLGPREEHVGHDAVGEEIPEDPPEGLPEPRHGAEELDAQARHLPGGDGGEVLAALRQAGA
ncbi:scopoletin glucosyltransferase-like [Iris pallida]|uniref:Scopoletin glucosyltransferase-like n=1 Tax=Iris pallida TaxID=29817 RepID=A0AAX6DZP1_IRIPA|nr:scopoletin glucosyltransferase-like [Iris pallida]